MINNELEKALNELKGITSDEDVANEDDDFLKIQELEAFLQNEHVDARALITVSKNNMVAKLVLKEPSKGGNPITVEAIELAIAEKGITHGIKNEYIQRLISFSVYDKSFIIAEGQDACDGSDEYVEFLLDEVDNLTPTVLSDGTVDYKNLGFCKSVDSGTVLGRVHPPSMGQEGFDIFGKTTPCKEGKVLATPPTGDNTDFADDNITIVSTIAGNVSFKNNRIDVRLEQVVNNVDRTTGNIHFSGDVRVIGDVHEGFEVKCGGNINIGGLVENGVLISGGDIIVAKGIHGEHSKIFAEGGIRSGHVENATLNCKDSIYIDYALNANVVSGNKVFIEGKHGYFIGGICTASYGISAKTIGNEANSPTVVQVLEGQVVDPEVAELGKKVLKYTDEISKLTIAWRDVSKMQGTREQKQQATERITELKKRYAEKLTQTSLELDKLELERAKDADAVIEVKERIFPNVLVKIDGIENKTKSSKMACKVFAIKDKIEYR